MVVAGTNTLNEGGVIYTAERTIIHPRWGNILIRNDVALLRVSEDIEFGEKVQPIALPTENFTKEDYPAQLSGWGRSTVSLLFYLQLNVSFDMES